MGVAKNDKTKSHCPRPTIVGLTAPEINYLFQEMLKDTPLVVPKNSSNDLQMTLNDIQMNLIEKICVPLIFTRQMAQK